MNTTFAILQYHDADTKQMLRDLQEARKRESLAGRRPRHLASRELLPSIECYLVMRSLEWVDTTETAGPADATFLSPKDVALQGARVTWKRYSATGNFLAAAPELLAAPPTSVPPAK